VLRRGNCSAVDGDGQAVTGGETKRPLAMAMVSVAAWVVSSWTGFICTPLT
jgi:hypothetical protein